jgi:hypothetical protein
MLTNKGVRLKILRYLDLYNQMMQEGVLWIHLLLLTHVLASEADSGKTDATRTLLRVKQKLQGYEYGDALTV